MDKMPKRFTDTAIWDEDWFIAMPKEYQFFWMFLKDNCDHAGIWKPNLVKFNKLFDMEIDLKKALELINSGKERIQPLPNGRWYLTGFLRFQYGKSLNPNSRVHESVLKLLEENEVNLTSTRPLIEVIDRVKDKDKDKDISEDRGVGKETKTKYLEYILLTGEEHANLVKRFGEYLTNDYIQRLNDYIGSKGVKYKSHYHTILNWSRKDGGVKKEPSYEFIRPK